MPAPVIGDRVVIEDDVFLGARSIVLKGVRIGTGSVIGAGSVVSRSIPPGSIAAGNPCRVIGKIASE
ncbi:MULTISPECIES: DapH/DapD/GlmU-related protein [unclassified Cryobacterium]|nr:MULTISPECIES: DapH/DapD/GlmU-related protein [unclassified Cryobacterium]